MIEVFIRWLDRRVVLKQAEAEESIRNGLFATKTAVKEIERILK